MAENSSETEPDAIETREAAEQAGAERSGMVAHPYHIDDEYRRFADDFDWGII